MLVNNPKVQHWYREMRKAITTYQRTKHTHRPNTAPCSHARKWVKHGIKQINLFVNQHYGSEYYAIR